MSVPIVRMKNPLKKTINLIANPKFRMMTINAQTAEMLGFVLIKAIRGMATRAIRASSRGAR